MHIPKTHRIHTDDQTQMNPTFVTELRTILQKKLVNALHDVALTLWRMRSATNPRCKKKETLKQRRRLRRPR